MRAFEGVLSVVSDSLDFLHSLKSTCGAIVRSAPSKLGDVVGQMPEATGKHIFDREHTCMHRHAHNCKTTGAFPSIACSRFFTCIRLSAEVWKQASSGAQQAFPISSWARDVHSNNQGPLRGSRSVNTGGER